MGTITFNASDAHITAAAPDQFVITIEGDLRDIADNMDIDDRLHDIHPRDIIDEVGATKLLDAFSAQEITTWVQDTQTDTYYDLLNAIGLESIREYLLHVD